MAFEIRNRAALALKTERQKENDVAFTQMLDAYKGKTTSFFLKKARVYRVSNARKWLRLEIKF